MYFMTGIEKKSKKPVSSDFTTNYEKLKKIIYRHVSMLRAVAFERHTHWMPFQSAILLKEACEVPGQRLH